MSIRLPPLHSWTSALIAIVVGFGGTVALIIQALRTLSASVDQTASAVTALCLGMAFGSIALSIRMRMPIVIAWSVPGAALLVASAPGVAWPVAIGVFLVAGLLMVLVGLVPALGRLAERVPMSLASAMLAGVLLPFCLDAFRIGAVDPLLIAVLVGVFILGRQLAPLYALLLVLAAGMALTLLRQQVAPLPHGATLGTLVPTLPAFQAGAVVSLALPFFLVTLISQNLAGIMVLRAAGYAPRPGALLTGTGVMSLLIAPFGAPGVNLAAITAALCTNDDAHPDRHLRWVVAVIYGSFYLLLAVFSPALVRFFLALPQAVIAALAGIALVPALLSSLENMLLERSDRDASVLTFLATASGLALFGLGSAFWGLAVGFAVLGARALWSRSRKAQAGAPARKPAT
jgi:benzoate membrane transport protein